MYPLKLPSLLVRPQFASAHSALAALATYLERNGDKRRRERQREKYRKRERQRGEREEREEREREVREERREERREKEKRKSLSRRLIKSF